MEFQLVLLCLLVYIYWMFIYLMALPIWNFVLPVYAFWHFDDFTWGQTRKVDGGDKGHDHNDRQEIGPDVIPLRNLLTFAKWFCSKSGIKIMRFSFI